MKIALINENSQAKLIDYKNLQLSILSSSSL